MSSNEMLLQGTNAVASRSSPLAANGGASNGGIDENHPEDERNGICSKVRNLVNL